MPTDIFTFDNLALGVVVWCCLTLVSMVIMVAVVRFKDPTFTWGEFYGSWAYKVCKVILLVLGGGYVAFVTGWLLRSVCLMGIVLSFGCAQPIAPSYRPMIWECAPEAMPGECTYLVSND